MKTLTFTFLFLFPILLVAQGYYFPPADFNTWEQSEYTCDSLAEADLISFLDEKNTKAFIILKEGKILMEEYFDAFTRDSVWFWASAGKTVTSVLIGIAAEDGDLSIDDPTENYLDDWTICSAEDQEKITIRSQLTMTTGLDENFSSFECTMPECLSCLQDPDTRWFYHNAPYTLLQDVYQSATGLTATQGFNQKIGLKIGAFGAFIPSMADDNKVFFSRPRDMARFGLLALNNGVWNNTQVYGDSDYFEDMRNTSQTFNKAYGYLWWLNGKESYRIPTFTIEFNGGLIPDAPEDLYMGLGAQDQKLYIVPSQDLVVIRMGWAGGSAVFALSDFDDQLWEKIDQLNCQISTNTSELKKVTWKIYPNPVGDLLSIKGESNVDYLILKDELGREVYHGALSGLNLSNYVNGIYQLKIVGVNGEEQLERLVIMN